jgi:hypothetical protein
LLPIRPKGGGIVEELTLEEQLDALHGSIDTLKSELNLSSPIDPLLSLANANKTLYEKLFRSYSYTETNFTGRAYTGDRNRSPFSVPIEYSGGQSVLSEHSMKVNVIAKIVGVGVTSANSFDVTPSQNEDAYSAAYALCIYASSYAEALLKMESEKRKDVADQDPVVMASRLIIINSFSETELTNLRNDLVNATSDQLYYVDINEEQYKILGGVAGGIYPQTVTVNMQTVVAALADAGITSIKAAIGFIKLVEGFEDFIDGATDYAREGLLADIADALDMPALNPNTYDYEGLVANLANAETSVEAGAVAMQATENANAINDAVDGVQDIVDLLAALVGEENIPVEFTEAISNATIFAGTFTTLADDAALKAIELKAEETSNDFLLKIGAFNVNISAANGVATEYSPKIAGLGVSLEMANAAKSAAEYAKTTLENATPSYATLVTELAALAPIEGVEPDGTRLTKDDYDDAGELLESENARYTAALGALDKVIERAENIIAADAAAVTFADVIKAYQNAQTGIASITNGSMFTKYGDIDFSNADDGVNELLNSIETDLNSIKSIIELSDTVNSFLSNTAYEAVAKLLVDSGLLKEINLESILETVMPDFGDIIEGALSQYLEDGQLDGILEALGGITGDLGLGDLFFAESLIQNIDDAIRVIETIRDDFNFGNPEGVQLQQTITFTKSVVDGSIVRKYENLNLDSLTAVGTLLKYVKDDVEAVTTVVRSADVIDRNLQKYLGDNSASDYVLHYLQDTLPGLVDGLLDTASVDLGGLAVGDFIEQALGSLADLEFDATGTALEYLGYVSDALGEIQGVYDEIAALFTYDGGGYIKGIELDEVLAALGLDRSDIAGLIDGVLGRAAVDLGYVLSKVGVDAEESAKAIHDALKDLADSTADFKEFVAQLEGMAEYVNGLYKAAGAYLNESELRDILSDVLKYYGKDIKDAVADLLSDKGLTPEKLAAIVDKLNKAKETVESYIEMFNKIKTDTDAFIAWAKGITEDDVRNAAEALARQLAARVAYELGQALKEAALDAGIPQKIAEIRAKAELIVGEMTKIYNSVKAAIDKANDIYEWLDENVTDAKIKAALKTLADELMQKALDELKDFAKLLQDHANAKLQDICDKLHEDLRDIVTALDCLYDYVSGKLDAKAEALIDCLESLISQHAADKAVIDAAIKAAVEAALAQARADVEDAIAKFLANGDVKEFLSTVEDIAKTVYDGFDYAIKYIDANKQISIIAEDGTGDVHYELFTDYDYGLNLPLFGEEQLGNTLQLLEKLGFTFEYQITARDDDYGYFGIDGNKVVGDAPAGDYEIKVGYFIVYEKGGYRAEYSLAGKELKITIDPVTPPVTLASIEVKVQTDKYTSGQAFVLADIDIEVEVTYSDGSTELIDWTAELTKGGVKVEDGDILETGDYTLTVTYVVEGVTIVETYTITVADEPPVSQPVVTIDIDVTGAKKSYTSGDAFSYEGIIVTETDEDDIVTPIPSSDWTVTATKGGASVIGFGEGYTLETGTYAVTVSYDNGSSSDRATYQVVVEAEEETLQEPRSITVSGATTQYTAGDALSFDGMTVTLRYSDGSSELITTGWTASIGGVPVQAGTVLTAGTYTVTISYGNMAAEYTITVGSGGGGTDGGGSGGTTTATIADEATPLATIEDEATPLAGFITDRIAYINGYPDGTVRPDGGVTRAEVAAMLFRLLSDVDKDAPLTSEFADVEAGKWYSQAVAYLTSIGILTGYEDGSFKPNAHITRAEFSAIVSRFDESTSASDAAGSFSDVSATHWAFAFIGNVVEKGWLSGYPDGTFKPQNAITRAETVTAINNMLSRELAMADVPADAPVYTDLSRSHWAYTDIIEATYDWVKAAAEAAADDADEEAGDETEAAEAEAAAE